MKRTTTTIIATALSAVLATGALAGCGSQQAAPSEEPAATEATTEATTEAATEQTTEELVAEFKEAAAKAPTYQSVTITAEETTTLTGEDANSDENITSKTVYKFDNSGDQLKTSADAEIADVKMTYYTDGDAAVLVTDEGVYSGTVEQFELNFADGVEAFLKESVGSADVFADCAAEVEKTETNGLTFYTLTLDPQKYTASDESLQMLADYGSPIEEALVTIGFEEDGSLASLDRKLTYPQSTFVKNMSFSVYNATVVDPMPEATKTFEEMGSDIETKLGEFEENLGAEATE
ncbi:MAG: hypothetical protein IKF14_11655 [Atopobiaceae bacterium]|nr:hypothetical protein [Atopobiaceae bacterium]